VLKGLYTAASGMLAELIHTDMLADNLANVSTVGYKRRNSNMQAFPEMMMERVNRLQNRDAKAGGDGRPMKGARLGAVHSGASLRETKIMYDQGTLFQTGNKLDVALEGNGFFVVQGGPNNQQFYTRAGHFIVDSEGFLSTPNGQRILGEGNAPIELGQNLSQVSFTDNGGVFVNNEQVGQMRLVTFSDPGVLQKYGEALFQLAPNKQNVQPVEAPPGTLRVVQGSLEMSNTNAIYEMMQTITALRYYESMQRNISVQNETLGRLITEAGKIR
jgi:flagellar basal-body rod protein FlgF